MGLLTTNLRYKGEFEYVGLYNMMKSFFDSRDYDWFETKYKDKGDEFEVDWTVEREYDEYHKVIFKISFHAWDVEKIEFNQVGKPKSLIKARIHIQIESDLKLDYNKPPMYDEGDKIQKILKKLHTKITQREVDEHWEAIPFVMQHDLMNEIKSYLGMRG